MHPPHPFRKCSEPSSSWQARGRQSGQASSPGAQPPDASMTCGGGQSTRREAGVCAAAATDRAPLDGGSTRAPPGSAAATEEAKSGGGADNPPPHIDGSDQLVRRRGNKGSPRQQQQPISPTHKERQHDFWGGGGQRDCRYCSGARHAVAHCKCGDGDAATTPRTPAAPNRPPFRGATPAACHINSIRHTLRRETRH